MNIIMETVKEGFEIWEGDEDGNQYDHLNYCNECEKITIKVKGVAKSTVRCAGCDALRATKGIRRDGSLLVVEEKIWWRDPAVNDSMDLLGLLIVEVERDFAYVVMCSYCGKVDMALMAWNSVHICNKCGWMSWVDSWAQEPQLPIVEESDA